MRRFGRAAARRATSRDLAHDNQTCNTPPGETA